jgi:phage-related minor tail protein
MADDMAHESLGDIAQSVDRLEIRFHALAQGANAFSKIMAATFAQSVVGARSFDDALKSVGLRLSGMAVNSALRSVFDNISAAFRNPSAAKDIVLSNVQPFAAGGVINTPSYFPLGSGGIGLAGEAGPEAIMPLARGPDGRLGVAAGGAGASHITVNISTQDAESFRRSEVFVTGQIARAVARGQRGL